MISVASTLLINDVSGARHDTDTCDYIQLSLSQIITGVSVVSGVYVSVSYKMNFKCFIFLSYAKCNMKGFKRVIKVN